MSKELSFSGTRHGMTQKQIATCLLELAQLYDMEYRTLRQGCCIGSDEQICMLVRLYFGTRFRIIGHPPRNESKMSKLAVAACDDLWLPKEYLVRNRDMNSHSEFLLATPWEGCEIPHGSGTWATIRDGADKNLEGSIVLPNGNIRTLVEFRQRLL